MIFSQFTFYYFAAILLQCLILTFMKKKEIGTRYLYALAILFLVSNIIIFCGFFVPRTTTNIEILLRLFYAALSLLFACFLSHAIEVGKTKENGFARQIENGVWIVAFCTAILSIFTDEILTGYRPMSFTATAIQGDMYWVFRTHLVMALLTAGTVLVRQWMHLRDHTKKMHCLFILIAYVIIIFSVLIVTALMQYGVEVNLDTTFPLFSTLSLSLIVYGDFKYGWVSESKLFQKQHETSDVDQKSDITQLENIFTRYTESKLSFNEASEKIDYLLLSHAYNKHDGNMLKTAQAMGLGRSTLYKKVRKHKLR